MTIEVHQPELEALIQRRMATGDFLSVEDLLLKALEASPVLQPHSRDGQSLDQVFAAVRGLFADGELDFSRNPSPRAWLICRNR